MTGAFGDLPPGQRSWMALMMDQIARLERLLGDFRDGVHLELLGDFTPALDRLDLGVFVSEAAEASRAEIERSGTELRIDIQKGLGPVRADPDGLRRAVLGALDHARKFRRAGPISVSVKGRGIEGEGAQTVVEYEGPPLTQAQARETLRLFQAEDRTNTNIPMGTGLGLGLAREVLGACGGGLAFDVDPQGRARIALTLPAAL